MGPGIKVDLGSIAAE